MNPWRPPLPPGYAYADELVNPGLPENAHLLTSGVMPVDLLQPPMPPPARPTPEVFVSSESEWWAVDSIRWGDSDVMRGIATILGPAPVAVAASKQLSRLKVPRPIVWLLQLNADGSQIPAGEVNPITVTITIAFGCGQARSQVQQSIVLLAANGYHIPPGTPLASFQVFVPAADLQSTASVSYTPTVAGPFAVEASVMCAPWYAIEGRGPRR
jgi:hypothetical protein